MCCAVGREGTSFIAGGASGALLFLRLEEATPGDEPRGADVERTSAGRGLGRGLTMTAGHQRTIEAALTRLGFLASGAVLPEPYRMASGAVGKSAVYFLALPRGDSMVNLVAKLDEPERAAREWGAIEALRKLNTPLLAMLPVHGNVRTDEVIIYHDASAVGPGIRTCELDGLLRDQLLTNPASCVKGLELMWQTLDLFYRAEPGAARPAARGHMLTWERAFPHLSGLLATITAVATQHWPWMRNWGDNTLALPPTLPSAGRPLPNPLVPLAEKLASLTGPIMLSGVHGDLNLRNVLISVDGTARPVGALIIDLASSERDTPTALDLARLETELWHEVLADVAPNEGALLATLLAVRDCLEGRTETLRPTQLPGLALDTLRVTCTIRQHAIGLLRASLPGYLLEDYVTILYLQHLLALSYPSVNEHPVKAQVAILGAALALEFLHDLRAGRYASDAAKPLYSPLRSYEEMTGIHRRPVAGEEPHGGKKKPRARSEGLGSRSKSSKYSVSIGHAEKVIIGDRTNDQDVEEK